jgi:hypothetical protein
MPMGANDEPMDLGSRMRGIVLIVAAVILVAFCWSHRPLDMRNFGEATQAELDGDWVLKTPFFYGSFAVAAGLVIMGVKSLTRRSEP